MRAGIITIPNSRTRQLNELVDTIESAGVPVTVYMDYQKRGAFWNYTRMFYEMLESAKKDEQILLMTDDGTTIPNWREYFNEIHKKAKSDIYCFYAKQRHLFTDENIKRGYVTKVQPKGFYDVAVVYINQQTLPSRVFKWLETDGHKLINKHRQKHHDVVIQDYLVHNNIPWTITTPTLFNHAGYQSTLGHSYDKGSPLAL